MVSTHGSVVPLAMFLNDGFPYWKQSLYSSLMLRNSKSLVVLIFGISLSVVFASCRSFPGFPPKMNRNCQSGRSASPAKTELLYILH